MNTTGRRADNLLLTACLATGDSAVRAWQTFQQSFDLDADGPRYMPFLPLLEENLAKHGFEEPLAGRFKGMRKQIWYRNQLFTKRIAELLTEFESIDIKPICLADLGMSQHYYSSSGLRPIRCAEFFVDESDLPRVTSHLSQVDWKPQGHLFRGQRLAWSYNDDVSIAFRIHTGIAGLTLQECCDRAIDFPLHGVAANTLSAFDLLLYLLASRPSSRIKRMLSLCDAAALLKHDSLNIDWQRAHTQPLRLAPRLTLCASIQALSKIGVTITTPALARSLADAHTVGRFIPAALFSTCANVGSRFAFLNR